ncbi:alpha/beta fold hydrolase [Mycobacteroides chelonae]|uniref:Alpha/beta fold hydrolase n=1 Tax=Mycobacteroides chelonae TaxID=1774 RepID=A0AB73TVB1_MYCCH|nr:alpha/beta fold hydrolase [Mycobacteroides chelonae]MBF9352897.1 alpha/beta fold hydrolase [Mycobacteroides chelonae]MEC4841298.1 alpha/beta fold hydrolase [Mycobacteroides chelonae]MEC4845662.1 alpha/beta fold hydrolase [Mycobacteroides chelonae]MEC4854753.1 alpha/beta fold hydrolase [Mycobacteroides chelonae]MEC4869384.1 alpha/beta fold hydrolase [Mycobacteroides chelonae]
MTEWHRIDKGFGEPLVLLHGGGASAPSWLPVIDLLAAHRRVIAFDIPGFGRTPALDQPLTIELMVDGVIAELARLGIDAPVDFVGNSMGGWISLEAAKRGLARSVVALGPAGLWHRMPLLTRLAFFAALSVCWIAHTPARVLLRSSIVRAVAFYPIVVHPGRLTYEQAVGLVADMHTSRRTLLSILRRIAFRGGFEAGQDISVPVTIAFGSHDRIVLARDSRHRDQLPPHATWVTLAGCGHLPMPDDPELVAAAILDGVRPPNGDTAHDRV